MQLLYDTAIPFRLRLICHCGREIVNRLPDSISGEPSPTRYEPTEQIKRVKKEWERLGLAKDGALPTILEAPQLQSLITEVAPLVAKDKEVEDRLIRRAQAMFGSLSSEGGALSPGSTTAASRWITAGQFFAKHAHMGPHAAVPKEQEVEDNFRFLENALIQVTDLMGFFEGVSEIDDILQQANNTTA